MRRHRVVLSSVTLAGGAFAFLLGTVGSSTPADAVDSDPRPPRTLPARRVAPARTVENDRPVTISAVQIDHVVQLSPHPADALPASSALVPTWDPERVWPMPDVLPDAPVVHALQEVMSLDGDARTAALDSLELALLEDGPPTDPWVHLAHLEAERALARAAYDEGLAHHEAELVAWAERGGSGPLPVPPAPWSAAALADEAEALALAIDAFGAAPEAADLARLTAAAGRLDWTADAIDEHGAVEVLLDVVAATDDPLMLAGAIDLLVGTDTELPKSTLTELSAVAPELPGDVALRLSWFVADQWLDRGDPAASLRALDHGIHRGMESDGPGAHDTLASLTGARGALLGVAHGGGGTTLTEAVDALAWGCWMRLMDEGAPWVSNGTDYGGTLVVLPSGARWVDWTDTNPHQACMAQGASQLPDTPAPTQLRLGIQLAL